MNSEGGNPVQIAKNLKRSYFTVRKWLLSFKNKERGKSISEDTAERALKYAGISYKRPKKSMPFTAPSKE